MLVEQSIIASLALRVVQKVIAANPGVSFDGIKQFLIDGFHVQTSGTRIEIRHVDFHVVMENDEALYLRGSYLGLLLVAFEEGAYDIRKAANV